jgi:hypothetical protein
MNLIQLTEKVNSVAERVIKKKVIRQGRKKIIKVSDRPNFEIRNGKEIKTNVATSIKRQKSQKRGALKRKKSKSLSLVKRTRSNRLVQ